MVESPSVTTWIIPPDDDDAVAAAGGGVEEEAITDDMGPAAEAGRWRSKGELVGGNGQSGVSASPFVRRNASTMRTHHHAPPRADRQLQ